jgi:hypothetical protein
MTLGDTAYQRQPRCTCLGNGLHSPYCPLNDADGPEPVEPPKGACVSHWGQDRSIVAAKPGTDLCDDCTPEAVGERGAA